MQHEPPIVQYDPPRRTRTDYPAGLSYCPGYRHKAPVADQLPPAFAHRSSGEGSMPGCASLAQPARGASSESTLSRVRTVAANLMALV